MTAKESKRLLYDFLRAVPMQREAVASSFAAILGVDEKIAISCWKRLRYSSNEKPVGKSGYAQVPIILFTHKLCKDLEARSLLRSLIRLKYPQLAQEC